jgi:ABC-type multidrug transport system fused ATPase/permease subunit
MKIFGKNQNINNYFYIYKELWKYDKKIFLNEFLEILVCVIASFGTLIIPAIFVGLLESEVTIYYMIIFVLSMFALFGLVCSIKDYFKYRNEWQYIEFRGDFLLRKILRKVISIDFALYEKEETQKLAQNAMDCVNSNSIGAEKLLHVNVTLIISILNFIVYTVVISTINLYILLLLVVISLIHILVQNRANNYELKNRDDKAKCNIYQRYINTVAYDVSAEKDIRIFSLQSWLNQMLDINNKKYSNMVKKEKKRNYLSDFTSIFLKLVKGIICYGYLIHLVMNGMNISMFILYLGAISGFTTFFNSITIQATEIRKNLKMLSYFRKFLSLTIEGFDVQSSESDKIEDNETYSIEFSHATFKYPKSDVLILNDVSFVIEKGKKIALVGINGAGKSTIVKLICGFYKLDSGNIYINGVDINNLNLINLYKSLAIIFQEPFIYSLSIYDNVTSMDDQKESRARCVDALKKADLWSKIAELEKKEDTYLNKDMEEEGISLSGGELQKLMLAKALYKNARMFILDEPTAALDAIAESDIYNKYNDLVSEKTSIFISHRLASTRFCDEILFLQDGVIKERGTHQQLLSSNGVYAYMYEVQSQYYKHERQEINNG